MLAVVFLNDLNGRAHVTGHFEHANAIPECVNRIKVPQATSAISLVEEVLPEPILQNVQ